MKGIYLQNSKYHKENKTGIYKKILGQINAIKSNGIECSEIIQNDYRNKNSIIAAIIHRLPFTNTSPRWEFLPEFEDVDYLYFRRPSVITRFMRTVLRTVHERNPQIKVIMELPTYPYDHELAGFLNKTLLWKDRYNRKHLNGAIDRIAVIDPTRSIKEIWGIPAIPFLNGIDVESLPLRDPKGSDGIHMLGVAYFSKWHGYERVINGMHNYYLNGGKEQVFFDLVGEGPELEKYMVLAKKFKLDERVIFHGKKTGNELNQIFNNAAIGVIGLNWYKYGYKIIGDLKSREYLSRGLPILVAGTLDVELVEKMKYIFNTEMSDEPIEIEAVIEFCRNIYGEKKTSREIAGEIREYAKRTIDMKIVMKDIISYIQDI